MCAVVVDFYCVVVFPSKRISDTFYLCAIAFVIALFCCHIFKAPHKKSFLLLICNKLR